MNFLNNISFLFRDGKKLSPQGEQWRELLHQISDIVENYILVYYNKLTKGRQISSQLTGISYSYMPPEQLSLPLVFSHHIILQTSMLRIYPAVIKKTLRKSLISNKLLKN
jgi:hypothetical protein